MSDLTHRMLAVGLLLGIVSILVTVVFIPQISSIFDGIGDLETKSARLARYEALIAKVAAPDRAFDASRIETLQSLLLDVDSVALAEAGLQQIVSQQAAASGLRVNSTEAAPSRRIDAFVKISLRANLVGDVEALIRFLRGLEEQRVFVSIEDAAIRSTGDSHNNQPPRLTVSLTIGAFLLPQNEKVIS